jgi:hypothetical protein
MAQPGLPLYALLCHVNIMRFTIIEEKARQQYRKQKIDTIGKLLAQLIL